MEPRPASLSFVASTHHPCQVFELRLLTVRRSIFRPDSLRSRPFALLHQLESVLLHVIKPVWVAQLPAQNRETRKRNLLPPPRITKFRSPTLDKSLFLANGILGQSKANPASGDPGFDTRNDCRINIVRGSSIICVDHVCCDDENNKQQQTGACC